MSTSTLGSFGAQKLYYIVLVINFELDAIQFPGMISIFCFDAAKIRELRFDIRVRVRFRKNV